MDKDNKFAFAFLGLLMAVSCMAFCIYSGITVFAVRYLIIAAGLSLFFGFCLFCKYPISTPKSIVFYLYIASLVTIGLSMIDTVNIGESLFVYSKYVLAFLLVIILYSFFMKDKNTTRKMLFVVCVIILLANLSVAFIEFLIIEDFSFHSLYHVIGLCGNKTFLTIMLFVLSSFAFANILEMRKKIHKLLLLIIFAVSFAFVILIKSRAAILSYVGASLFFAIMYFTWKKRISFSKRIMAWTIVSSVILVFLFFTVGLRLLLKIEVSETSKQSEVEYNYLSTSSLVERTVVWKKTYEMIDDHPINGCGVGNWQVVFPDYGLQGLYRADYWNANFTRPHNEFLCLLAECGYIPFLVCMIFVVSLVVKAFFAICNNHDKREFIYGAVILSAFIGCCINSFFSFPNDKTEFFIWKAVIYAVLFTYITKNEKGNDNVSLDIKWKSASMAVLVFFTIIGVFRFRGERYSAEADNAMKINDWNMALRCSEKAVSAFYTIDDRGFPVNWYIGKAKEQLGIPGSIENYRKAYREMPFCKQNLNDLGSVEYVIGNKEVAISYFEKAIHVSPNFLYPSFNLSYIYMKDNKLDKAADVICAIDMDDNKRKILIRDAKFYESGNIDEILTRIENEYQTTLKLRRTLQHLLGE